MRRPIACPTLIASCQGHVNVMLIVPPNVFRSGLKLRGIGPEESGRANVNVCWEEGIYKLHSYSIASFLLG